MPLTTRAMIRQSQLGSFNNYVATATVQDTPAGQAVQITVSQELGGDLSINLANELRARLYKNIDSGVKTLVKEFVVVDEDSDGIIDFAELPQVFNFYLTDTGEANGVPMLGILELAIYGKRSDLGSTTWEQESDGTPNVAQTGWSGSFQRAAIRGIGAAHVDSNFALAAVEDVLTLTADLEANSYEPRTLSLNLGPDSGVSNTAVDLFSRNIVVDETFPNAETLYTPAIVVPKSLFADLEWTVLTVTADEVSVDPRYYASLHLQVDDDVFDLSKSDSDCRFQIDESGFGWARITNAKDVALAGLTVNQTLDPVKPGATIGPVVGTTNVDGYTDTYIALTESKPSGQWVWSITINGVTNDYIVDRTKDVYMVAAKRHYGALVGLGVSPATGGEDANHFTPGTDLLIGCTLVNNREIDLVVPSTLETFEPAIVVGRFRTDGKIEFLEDTLAAWTVLPDDVDPLTTANKIPMVRADGMIPGADTRVYLRLIPAAVTDAWPSPYTQLHVVGIMFDQDLGMYHSFVKLDPVGKFGGHHKPLIRPLV